MQDRAILLKKKIMKNKTGFYLSFLTEEKGLISFSAFSARGPSRTYLGLDYFRILQVDVLQKKDNYYLDSILSLDKDFSKEVLKNMEAYKIISYIQQVLIKILEPICFHLSKEVKKKLFNDFIFVLDNIPKAKTKERLIKITYRFLKKIYSEAGFIDRNKKELELNLMLDEIREYHIKFLDNSIKFFYT